MNTLAFSRTCAPSPWSERLQPWAAALASALLHVLMVLLLLHSQPPLVSAPQGASSGGRVKVDFVGEPAPTLPTTPPQDTPRPVPKPATRPRQDTRKPVLEARYAEPPAAPALDENREPPTPEPAPPSPPAPSEPAQRRPQTWSGRPPGWVDTQTSPDAGRSPGPADRGGTYIDRAAGEPAMQVGGYQIIYELLRETRLRAWMAEGIKELSIPLPGTRYLMVCPAEVALRRGSSSCRLLPPDSPELESIGDAREIIMVMNVYRQGELVWQGPGPYR